jgi:hypothetical protein
MSIFDVGLLLCSVSANATILFLEKRKKKRKPEKVEKVSKFNQLVDSAACDKGVFLCTRRTKLLFPHTESLTKARF